jgi:hypothetical protein
MPIAFILDFPDGSVEKYDAVLDRMGLEGRLPSGALFHVAGPGPAGGLRVIDVWESDGAFQAFADAEITPRTAEVGMSPPQITRFEAQVRDSGLPRRAITFAHVARLPLDAEGFRRLYEETMGGADLPDGVVFHANGPAPKGGWIVTGGWTSQDARDRFLTERVIPTARRHDMDPPVIEDLAVHAVLEPARAPARA